MFLNIGMIITRDDLMSGNTGDNEGDSGESTEEETEEQARQQAAAAHQRRLTSQGMAPPGSGPIAHRDGATINGHTTVILHHQNRIPANAAVNNADAGVKSANASTQPVVPPRRAASRGDGGQVAMSTAAAMTSGFGTN